MSIIKDIKGQKFGLLTPIEFLGSENGKRSKWLCQCDCGNKKAIRTDALTSGATKSCGCNSHATEHFINDLTGQRFGRLLVLKYSHSSRHRVAHFLCRCDCGTEKIISGLSLRKGATVSCGCYHKDIITKHSMSQTRLWSIWHKMKERCYNENHVHYENYGGRGIAVCKEWKDDFNAFKDWALANGYRENLTLDRSDNNKSYSPDNCRFATATEQMNNRRNNHLLTYEGETHTLAEWARIKGINPSTLGNRIKRGLTVEEAFNTPVDKRYSRP